MTAPPTPASSRRSLLLAALLAGSVVTVFVVDPIPQDPAYHAFADTRSFLGVPNGLNVLSNLAFLLVGLVGLHACGRHDVGPMRPAWTVFLVGVALVSAGSAWYHWRPDNASLVWDRLPMTLGFMGVVVAIVGESIDARVAKRLLLPALALGAGSVLYWSRTDDLRPYAWIQFMPLLLIPVVLGSFGSRYTHQRMLAVALGCYVLAKVAELLDRAVMTMTGRWVSGHTLKHLLAAAGCYVLVVMLRNRRPRGRVAAGRTVGGTIN